MKCNMRFHWKIPLYVMPLEIIQLNNVPKPLALATYKLTRILYTVFTFSTVIVQ